MTRFAKYSWFVLFYNLAAVAWGVFVRASKSGDGCGNNWPLCDGKVVPLFARAAQAIEYSHRVTTGLVLPLVIAMVAGAFMMRPLNKTARYAALFALFMTVVEALVGAVLVKRGLVTTNDSPARAMVMSFHVISTFLLVGSISITALVATGAKGIVLKGQSTVSGILGLAAAGMAFLAVSGAISALGHQLRPVDNVLGAAMDSHTFWMVRLQPLHPLIAAAVGLYLLLAGGLLVHLRPDSGVRQAVQWMVGIYAAQLSLGAINIYTKAPIPIQMLHLVLADINWISLVAVGVLSLGEGVARVELRPAPATAEHHEPLKGRALIKAYVALTKPRVISLLLFTTLAAAIAAKGGWPGMWLFLSVAAGGYMAAGAANAINMVIDRDIDFTMKRTACRPTVTQAIPSRNALLFAFVLAAGSFALLWGAANLLSAVLALSGLVFYVIVYTMLLKRRTWHNIVIGGAAGAFPPLVGWAAVTNDLPPLALYLFAIIVVWTPVHFWALALLLKDDYAAAGVPMLPVVKGDRNTVTQIGLYGIVTAIVSVMPFLQPQVGWIYVVGAVVLNVILLVQCVQLYQNVDRPRASSLFHYSMLYLALLFLAFAVDRTVLAQIGAGIAARSSAMAVRSTPLAPMDHQDRQMAVKLAMQSTETVSSTNVSSGLRQSALQGSAQRNPLSLFAFFAKGEKGEGAGGEGSENLLLSVNSAVSTSSPRVGLAAEVGAEMQVSGTLTPLPPLPFRLQQKRRGGGTDLNARETR